MRSTSREKGSHSRERPTPAFVRTANTQFGFLAADDSREYHRSGPGQWLSSSQITKSGRMPYDDPTSDEISSRRLPVRRLRTAPLVNARSPHNVGFMCLRCWIARKSSAACSRSAAAATPLTGVRAASSIQAI